MGLGLVEVQVVLVVSWLGSSIVVVWEVVSRMTLLLQSLVMVMIVLVGG